MRRLECGACRRRAWRCASLLRRRVGPRWCGACARASQARSRAASGHALGAPRPLREELADGPRVHHGDAKRGPEPKSAAAGRREACRLASLAGHLRRSGDGLDRETSRRVRRFRTSACRRSAPLIFPERKTDEGHPAPSRETGRRSVGCLTIEERRCARFSGPQGLLVAIARAGALLGNLGADGLDAVAHLVNDGGEPLGRNAKRVRPVRGLRRFT